MNNEISSYFAGSLILHTAYLAINTVQAYWPNSSPTVPANNGTYTEQIKNLNKVALEAAKELNYPNPQQIKTVRAHPDPLYPISSFGTAASGVIAISPEILRETPQHPDFHTPSKTQTRMATIINRCPNDPKQIPQFISNISEVEKKAVLNKIEKAQAGLTRPEFMFALGTQVHNLKEEQTKKELKQNLLISLVTVLVSQMFHQSGKSLSLSITFQMTLFLVLKVASSWLNKSKQLIADKAGASIQKEGAQHFLKREIILRELAKSSDTAQHLLNKVCIWSALFYEKCFSHTPEARLQAINNN